LNPIKVSDAYFPDFVRGFFDGDGTVYIYKVNGTSQIKAEFVNPSFSFIADFNQCLCQALKIPQKSIHQEIPKRAKRTRIIYSICFYVDDCEKLSQFMYQNNPSLYLPRKYKIFEKWKTIKRRKYIKQNYPSKIGWRLN
jgi:intein-encoded DNA endonuclease-like protein